MGSRQNLSGRCIAFGGYAYVYPFELHSFVGQRSHPFLNIHSVMGCNTAILDLQIFILMSPKKLAVVSRASVFCNASMYMYCKFQLPETVFLKGELFSLSSVLCFV